ncbi:hypothetical protein BDN72DRAFT_902865 [Pluteus cervinus]|uniref:Uncharacterized protein n=1 Tax=Pluteus cervinus TaxID=181527 RepID=A0ACD3ABS4_9AGAR|nr:hypothetical protein BDN72DRAFT_902865 [Pluteus cervinus]
MPLDEPFIISEPSLVKAFHNTFSKNQKASRPISNPSRQGPNSKRGFNACTLMAIPMVFGSWNQPPPARSCSEHREEYVYKAIKCAGLLIQDELLELFDTHHPLPEDGQKPTDPLVENGHRPFQEELDIITDHVRCACDKWIATGQPSVASALQLRVLDDLFMVVAPA